VPKVTFSVNSVLPLDRWGFSSHPSLFRKASKKNSVSKAKGEQHGELKGLRGLMCASEGSNLIF